MIPELNIIAWSRVAPWSEPRQVEQDLIISRAVIELFSDDFLKEQLRFRGGTALHKLHFPTPLRYSEDIDLVRTTHGGIGPILGRVREALDWLGQAGYDPSPVAPKLRFRADAEGGGAPLRLKVEIATRETEAYDDPIDIRHEVDNPWFSGEAAIPTFSPEEMLATKLSALLHRNKGRDLFDVARFFSLIGIKERLLRCLRHLKANPIYGRNHVMVMLLVVHLIIDRTSTTAGPGPLPI